MPEKVISLVNRKGGVSKTTSSVYLAMCLHTMGKPVIGIDTDPERSWLKWSDAGVIPYPVTAGDRDDLKKQVNQLEGYVVIDTPPNDGEVIYKAASISDEVIIPLAATALDVNRLASTLAIVADVEEMRNKPVGSVLLTKWANNFAISKEVETALAEQKVPLLETRIRNLTRYQGFDTPSYLEEYGKVIAELGVA
ncbi:MAG: hypothetical protein AVDCRST_MAG93-1912 [uncultured Chloroflexia bacterium]|uniref:AAA domain-containing protein n=1 Tax=uncultured Chloroflexia bacterium TaxID=1672391 RepID=A0A6J4IJT0_9CHLR|nr:MAG: hypothetical protein AVDCRST_MAG93-1912 [uncultured Chloroflexia bacterium]